jgi:hypothetical protein
MSDGSSTIEGVVERMAALLAPLEAEDDPRRYFLATYRRTTLAVQKALRTEHFVDPDWVERWDVTFASLYLDAVEAWTHDRPLPAPWAVAFAAGAGDRLPPLRHVLVGMNAHINFDLPLALLAVIDDDELADPEVVARRNIDHERIDLILASRVDAENEELKRLEEPGDRTWLDRLLTPFNKAASRRFMKEARRKVWRNTLILSEARREGPDELASGVAELEALARARVADLGVPGQVLLRLARDGFGVELIQGRPELDDLTG